MSLLRLISFVSCFLLAGVALADPAGQPRFTDGMRLFNELNEIQFTRDGARAMTYLENLQTLNIWSLGGFGSPTGPEDTTSVTISALGAFGPFLPTTSRPKDKKKPVRISQIRQWLESDVHIETEMVKMLSNQDPVARWIACDKLKNVERIPETLIEPLGLMAQDDSYLRINSHGDCLTPPQHPGEGEAFFSAPLREVAVQLLSKNTRFSKLKVNEEQLTKDGLFWLGRLFEDRAEDRGQILLALLGLKPVNPQIKAAQEQAKPFTATPDQALPIFKSLVQLGRR